MINHVVLFKINEFETTKQKQDVLAEFKERLLGLKNHIPQLKFIEVGLNYKIDSPSFDLCLITHFESVADLDIYRVHPEHVKVTEFAAKVVVSRAAVDYEF